MTKALVSLLAANSPVPNVCSSHPHTQQSLLSALQTPGDGCVFGSEVARKAVPARQARASSDHRNSPPTLMAILSMPTLCWHCCVSSSGTIMAGSFLPGCEASSSSILKLTHQPPGLLPLS